MKLKHWCMLLPGIDAETFRKGQNIVELHEKIRHLENELKYIENEVQIQENELYNFVRMNFFEYEILRAKEHIKKPE